MYIELVKASVESLVNLRRRVKSSGVSLLCIGLLIIVVGSIIAFLLGDDNRLLSYTEGTLLYCSVMAICAGVAIVFTGPLALQGLERYADQELAKVCAHLFQRGMNEGWSKEDIQLLWLMRDTVNKAVLSVISKEGSLLVHDAVDKHDVQMLYKIIYPNADPNPLATVS